MKSNVSRLVLCCGLLLGLGLAQGQDSNEPAPLPEAPETNSIRAQYRFSVLGLGDDVVVNKGEQCPCVIAIGGNARVDGEVNGLIFVLGGNLTLDGAARGGALVVGGSADVGSSGRAQRDFVVVGGRVHQAAGSTFERPPQEIGAAFGEAIEAVVTWVTHGLMLGRPVVPSLRMVWVVIGVFFALYLLIAVLFRNAAAASVHAIELHPIASLLTGFLVVALLAIIIGILVFTSAGLVLLPFVLCGIFFVAVMGKVAVYEFIGCRISDRLRPPGYGSLLGMTLGMAICVGLGIVPVLGFMVWGMVVVLGIGSVTLACFRLLHREVVATHSAFVAAAPAMAPVVNVPSPATPAAPAAVAAPPVINRHPPPFPLAGFWPRAGALALDLVVVGGTLGLVGLSLLFPLGLLIYSVGFLVWRGSTIGMIIAGLRCIRANGEPLTWQYAIARTVAGILSLLPLGLGFLWAALDPGKQTWHDKVAGTVVVKIPRAY